MLRRYLLLVSTCLALLLSGASAFAQSEVLVSGRVTSKSDKGPLAGAEIYIFKTVGDGLYEFDRAQQMYESGYVPEGSHVSPVLQVPVSDPVYRLHSGIPVPVSDPLRQILLPLQAVPVCDLLLRENLLVREQRPVHIAYLRGHLTSIFHQLQGYLSSIQCIIKYNLFLSVIG